MDYSESVPVTRWDILRVNKTSDAFWSCSVVSINDIGETILHNSTKGIIEKLFYKKRDRIESIWRQKRKSTLNCTISYCKLFEEFQLDRPVFDCRLRF